MIVRDEASIIKRCLLSALPYIDGYFIIDTGSKDDTINIIEDTLGHLPGVVLEEEWVNFAHNRTSLVRQAREAGFDYLLLGDADMTFEGELGDLTADGYLIRMSGDFEYHMPYLVSSRLNWWYRGVTHEFLGANEPFLQVKHPTFVINHLADGGRRTDGLKWSNDRELLEAEYAKGPDTELHDRTTFYLAQTCRDLGDNERAEALYRERADTGGWVEEAYWAMFMVGELSGDINDYLRAWNFRPSRPEAVQRMIKLENERRNYWSAYAIGSTYLKNIRRTEDVLFVERWTETWGILFEVAIAEFWIDKKGESRRHFHQLAAMPDLPDHIRDLVAFNLQFFGE